MPYSTVHNHQLMVSLKYHVQTWICLVILASVDSASVGDALYRYSRHCHATYGTSMLHSEVSKVTELNSRACAFAGGRESDDLFSVVELKLQ